MARGTPLSLEANRVTRYRQAHSLSPVDAAYIAGLVDGEGTITLSRRHAGDGRQLVISISSTERPILNFARETIGAGKITSKKSAKAHHAPAFTYAIGNRQALNLLIQIQPSPLLQAAPSRSRVRLLLATHSTQWQIHAPSSWPRGSSSKKPYSRCAQTPRRRTNFRRRRP
jgi:hypothetical protein